MTKAEFRSTELRAEKDAVFVNGDESSANKVLTNRTVSRNALRAVFHDRPEYFCAPTSKNTQNSR